jgi:hypothetical protein
MLQFGLKTMLLLTLFAAAACAVFFVLPTRLGALILFIVTLSLPAPIVTGIAYGHGYGRAFAIGAASALGAWGLVGIPIAFTFMVIERHYEFEKSASLFALLIAPNDSGDILRYYIACWPLVAIAGLLGAAVRWRALRSTPNR